MDYTSRPYQFKDQHTRGRNNVVADTLSRMFGHVSENNTEVLCAVLLDSLPLVYSSLAEHQAEDDFFADIHGRVQAKLPGSENFQIRKVLLCYCPRQAKRRRWVVPPSLREMLLKYFHGAVFSGHLGAWKTYHKIASNFWWPKMRLEIFNYVLGCELCQRAKPAHDSRVGLHSASPATASTERLFNYFVGPLTRTKCGKISIPVVVDSFSKFVSFCPVRKMTLSAVSDYLGRSYFSAFGVLKSIVTDYYKAFSCKELKDLCF